MSTDVLGVNPYDALRRPSGEPSTVLSTSDAEAMLTIAFTNPVIVQVCKITFTAENVSDVIISYTSSEDNQYVELVSRSYFLNNTQLMRMLL